MFNKSWILYVGQGNPGYMYRLGDKWMQGRPMEMDLGTLIDSKLNMHQQCAVAVKKVNCIPGCINTALLAG